MSAPASTQASARPMAASMPSTAIASVRAMITNCASVRASTAALTRSTISSFDTIALPGRWPQRLAATWSSMCSAPAPALTSERTVRAMLNAHDAVAATRGRAVGVAAVAVVAVVALLFARDDAVAARALRAAAVAAVAVDEVAVVALFAFGDDA